MAGVGSTNTEAYRKVGSWFVAAAAVLLIGNALRLTTNRYRLFDPTPDTRPIANTVTLKATLHRPDGSDEEKWVQTTALRSDGALVRRHEGAGRGATYAIRDIYLPTGVRVSTDDIAEAKSTGTILNFDRTRRDPASKCMNKLDGTPAAPEQRQLGQSVIQQIEVFQIQLPPAVDWLAPSLSCAVLYSRGNDGRTGYLEKTLVSILRGEPDPQLFMVPERFKEVAPTQLAGIR
jgi:hypothetical protein